MANSLSEEILKLDGFTLQGLGVCWQMQNYRNTQLRGKMDSNQSLNPVIDSGNSIAGAVYSDLDQATLEKIKLDALYLTRLELNTWKLHDKKLPNSLMNAMAKLYAEIYPISHKQAFEILEPWISAVWWHDIAETAEDGGGEMAEFSEMYWDKVKDGLVKHYQLLVSLLELDADAEALGMHDFGRWTCHHRREYEGYSKHDAAMLAALSPIPDEESYRLATLRADAVWMHNDTHIETGVSEVNAEELWEATFHKLTEFYETFLILSRPKQSINA